MTLKNTNQASAKLIRLKFNMLVLTIQDDLVGLYGYQKKKQKKNLLSFCQINNLGFKPTEKITWFSGGRNKDGLNPKYPAPPPPQKKYIYMLGPLVELNRLVLNI